MMKKHFIYLLLTALTLVVGGCSSSDDNDEQRPEEPQTPAYLTPGTDQRPVDWTFSDDGRFELRMSVQVELGDTLAAYQSSQDLMCATIDGEVRAVTPPCVTSGIVYYPLIIFDHAMGKTVSLRYYCDKLHRIYTISNWATFNPSAAPTGTVGFYRPRFTAEKQ